eukprot:1156235-Pelagomonas_calceolata.AAC.11
MMIVYAAAAKRCRCGWELKCSASMFGHTLRDLTPTRRCGQQRQLQLSNDTEVYDNRDPGCMGSCKFLFETLLKGAAALLEISCYKPKIHLSVGVDAAGPLLGTEPAAQTF